MKKTTKTVVRIAGVLAKIQTEHLSDMSPEHYCYTGFLGIADLS
jgi:hypothetical protein